jgi:hypothetical protein
MEGKSAQNPSFLSKSNGFDRVTGQILGGDAKFLQLYLSY